MLSLSWWCCHGAGIIVQTQRILCTVLDLALAQGYCFAFTHIDDVLMYISGGVSVFTVAKEQREAAVNISTTIILK